MLAPYRKLVVVIVGLGVTWITQRLGLQLIPEDQQDLVEGVSEAVMYGLTAAAVYWFPNQPLPPKP